MRIFKFIWKQNEDKNVNGLISYFLRSCEVCLIFANSTNIWKLPLTLVKLDVFKVDENWRVMIVVETLTILSALILVWA